MKKHLTKSIIIMAVLVLIMLTVGCSHVLIPLDGPMYRGKEINPEKIKVEVVPGQYFVKFDRDDPFLPVHVIIRNNTKHPVKVSMKNFLMLDDVGNKFRPAGLKEVMQYYALRAAFSVYPYHYHYGWHYRHYRPSRWWHPYNIMYSAQMIEQTFLESEIIEPDESTAGFIYFKGAAHFANEKVTLVAKFPDNDMKPLEYTFLID